MRYKRLTPQAALISLKHWLVKLVKRLTFAFTLQLNRCGKWCSVNPDSGRSFYLMSWSHIGWWDLVFRHIHGQGESASHHLAVHKVSKNTFPTSFHCCIAPKSLGLLYVAEEPRPLTFKWQIPTDVLSNPAEQRWAETPFINLPPSIWALNLVSTPQVMLPSPRTADTNTVACRKTQSYHKTICIVSSYHYDATIVEIFPLWLTEPRNNWAEHVSRLYMNHFTDDVLFLVVWYLCFWSADATDCCSCIKQETHNASFVDIVIGCPDQVFNNRYLYYWSCSDICMI